MAIYRSPSKPHMKEATKAKHRSMMTAIQFFGFTAGGSAECRCAGKPLNYPPSLSMIPTVFNQAGGCTNISIPFFFSFPTAYKVDYNIPLVRFPSSTYHRQCASRRELPVTGHPADRSVYEIQTNKQTKPFFISVPKC